MSCLISGRCFGQEVWETNHSFWPFPAPVMLCMDNLHAGCCQYAWVRWGRQRSTLPLMGLGQLVFLPLRFRLCEVKQCCWLLLSGPLPPQTQYSLPALWYNHFMLTGLYSWLNTWSWIFYLIIVWIQCICCSLSSLFVWMWVKAQKKKDKTANSLRWIEMRAVIHLWWFLFWENVMKVLCF